MSFAKERGQSVVVRRGYEGKRVVGSMFLLFVLPRRKVKNAKIGAFANLSVFNKNKSGEGNSDNAAAAESEQEEFEKAIKLMKDFSDVLLLHRDRILKLINTFFIKAKIAA